MNAAPSKANHCPDCGAQLKPGTDWCWLCNYKSPPVATAVGQHRSPQLATNWGAFIGIVLLALTLLPACAVAFFVSCSAVLILDGERVINVGDEFSAGLLTGLVGATIVAVLFCVLMITLARSIHRSSLSPDSRNAR